MPIKYNILVKVLIKTYCYCIGHFSVKPTNKLLRTYYQYVSIKEIFQVFRSQVHQNIFGLTKN